MTRFSTSSTAPTPARVSSRKCGRCTRTWSKWRRWPRGRHHHQSALQAAHWAVHRLAPSQERYVSLIPDLDKNSAIVRQDVDGVRRPPYPVDGRCRPRPKPPTALRTGTSTSADDRAGPAPWAPQERDTRGAAPLTGDYPAEGRGNAVASAGKRSRAIPAPSSPTRSSGAVTALLSLEVAEPQ